MLSNHLNKECWPHFLSLPSSVCVYTPKDSLFMFPGLCTSLRFTCVIYLFFFFSSSSFFFLQVLRCAFTWPLVCFSKRCDGRSKQDADQLKWFTQEILMHLLRWDKAALLHFKHLHVAGVAMSCCTACLYSWAIHLASGSPAHLYQLWKRRWKCKLTK